MTKFFLNTNSFDNIKPGAPLPTVSFLQCKKKELHVCVITSLMEYFDITKIYANVLMSVYFI